MIDMENINKIDSILKKLDHLIENISVEKRWLNISETANYICYSKESIHKMVKSGKFIEGIHYYKRIKKLIFDKEELDKWIQNKEPKNVINLNIDETIKDILSSINH